MDGSGLVLLPLLLYLYTPMPKCHHNIAAKACHKHHDNIRDRLVLASISALAPVAAAAANGGKLEVGWSVFEKLALETPLRMPENENF